MAKLSEITLIDIYNKIRLIMDGRKGLDFIMGVSNQQAGTDKKIAKQYHATYAPLVKHILKQYKITSRDIFCDYGCGKGEVLRVASNFPFGKIVGLELSEYIYKIAVENARILGWNNVELVNVDARDYKDIDRVTYFFFYNPFPEDVFDAVLQNIRQSYERNPREIRLIYHNPVYKHLVEKALFILEKTAPPSKMHLEVCIYHANKQ